MFRKILLSLIIILLFVQTSSAVINTLATGEALGVSPSYNPSYFITISGYRLHNSTSGLVEQWAIDDANSFTVSNTRVNEQTDSTAQIVYGLEDPTECTSGVCRVWFILHNTTTNYEYLAYTDNTLQDFGAGAYNPVTNPNGYHLVAAYTTATTGLYNHIAIDSNGNVYASDEANGLVYRYTKSSGYSSSLLYTLDPVDINTGGVTIGVLKVWDISVDSSDNVYILMGDTGAGATSDISAIIFDSSGTELANYIDLSGGAASSKTNGFIIPDTSNPLTNFHYSFSNATTGVIRHYTDGVTSLVYTGGNIIYDGIYLNSNIWFSDEGTPGTVSTTTTAYPGFSLPASGGGAIENTYTIKQVDVLSNFYYNNSVVHVTFYVSVDTNPLLITFYPPDYKWIVALEDPNTIEVTQKFSGNCELDFFLDNCIASGSYDFPAPAGNWSNGSWGVNLYEYNTGTFNRALLDTDSYTVYNNSSTPIPAAVETIESGTGATTLSQIDGWVGLLGLGVNGISKFLFAMILTLAVTFFGFIGTKGNSMGGAIVGALPFTFFVFIEFIPVWTIIIVVMVVAIKTGWFR